MSAYAATQFSKPVDGQDFERCCRVLWKCLLDDPNVIENGRSGQKQAGVDLWGYRDRDSARLVGVQCKLKAEGVKLTATEVHREIGLALDFKPPLQEYFIVTTAPDDVELQRIAREAVLAQKAQGRDIAISIWGWGVMQDRISGHLDAARAFDPSYGPFGSSLLAGQEEILKGQAGLGEQLAALMGLVGGALVASAGTQHVRPGDTTAAATAAEQAFDAEIDAYRDMSQAGQPRTALGLLERLLGRVGGTASGRILFRIKANIGFCRVQLGEAQVGANLLIEAYGHAPTEPKAIANKALGLLLLDRCDEVLAIGAGHLVADRAHEALASYVIQAAARIPGETDPWALIPEQLRELPHVEAAAIDFLRLKEASSEWWTAARDALRRHPDHDRIPLHAAEADLDEITRSPAFLATGILTDEQKAKLTAAAALMRRWWDRERAGERVVRPEIAPLCCNTAAALHLTDETAAARVVIEQGLGALPDDRDLLLRAAQLAVDANFDDLARRVLPKLADDPESLMFRFIHASHVGDWEDVARMGENEAAAVPPTERHVVATATRMARIKLGRADGSAASLRAILDDTADARSAIYFADMVANLGEEELAREALDRALTLVTEDSHAAARKMVALHAARAERWEVVADLLDGTVPKHRDGPELRWLATAFTNEVPIRPSALAFYAGLSPELRRIPFYLRQAGLMHYNRGALAEAERELREAIEVKPESAFAWLLLLMTLYRKGGREREGLASMISTLDATQLKGRPIDLISIARFMCSFGRPADAITFGYSVLQANRNDPQVAMRYAGIVLLAGDDDGRFHPESVQPDCWVSLREASGETCEFILAQADERPGEGVFGPGHVLAKRALGLKPGEAFEQERAFGEPLRWTVVSFQHRCLQAGRDIMENFERRFPGVPGFYRIEVDPERGIPPSLVENSRKQSESRRKAADLFASGLLPLSFLAHRTGQNPITFGAYVHAVDLSVRASIGTDEEWRAGQALAHKARARGIVLDAYTTWVAADAGILDVLKSLTGRVMVPRSVIDAIHDVDDRNDGLEPVASFGHWEGKPILTEVTREGIERRRRFLAERLTMIEDIVEVVPTTAPPRPTKSARLLTESWGTDALDPAYVAVAEGAILLSDDLVYRNFARAACGAEGIWLHLMLAHAHAAGVVDKERYASALTSLASWRHGHLYIDAPTFTEVLAVDDSSELDRFKGVALSIGGEEADMAAHLRCAAQFLLSLWRSEPSWSRRTRASHIMLECLFRHTTAERAAMVSMLHRLVDQEPALANYLKWWSWLHRKAPPSIRRPDILLDDAA